MNGESEETPGHPDTDGLLPHLSGHEAILLVDDEADLLNVLGFILQQHGYQVLTSISGTEALNLSRAHPIDILVTDIHLPDVKGDQVAKAMRSIFPRLKILFLSGDMECLTEELLLNAGTAILEKPFTPVRLLELIRKLLDDT